MDQDDQRDLPIALRSGKWQQIRVKIKLALNCCRHSYQDKHAFGLNQFNGGLKTVSFKERLQHSSIIRNV